MRKTMKKMKEKKGITLIALVATIAVILILAGITVGMVTSDNGILKETRKDNIGGGNAAGRRYEQGIVNKNISKSHK